MDIIEYCEKLDSTGKYIISKQLLRSATSMGANVHEVQNLPSKNDFIYKIKIAAKEVEETKYGLYLCVHSKTSHFEEKLKEQILEISKIIYKILSTSISTK